MAVWEAGTNAYEGEVEAIGDHWGRVFIWSERVAADMLGQHFKWEDALAGIRNRAIATRTVVRPLFDKIYAHVKKVGFELFPDLQDPGYVSIGVSNIRLSPGTVGLTEPPTDRRPYIVVSISPRALRDMHYLKQVILHECIHIVVQARGGEPHNERFHTLAEKLGLEPKYRD